MSFIGTVMYKYHMILIVKNNVFIANIPVSATKYIMSVILCPRDLEHENCISFVTKLLYYARQDERSDEFDVDSFYKTHRDDLIAMSRTNFQLLNFYFSQSTINEL